MISEPGTGGDPDVSDNRRPRIYALQRGAGHHAAGLLARRLSEITKNVVETSGGSGVEFPGGALAAFVSARSAIGAAVELRRRLADATFSDESLPLPAGVGLNAGEAVPIEGRYRGGALTLAARLCGMAGPGEILASQEIVHLAGRMAGVTYE